MLRRRRLRSAAPALRQEHGVLSHKTSFKPSSPSSSLSLPPRIPPSLPSQTQFCSHNRCFLLQLSCCGSGPATTSATLLWMRSRYYLSKDLVVADYVAAAAVPLLLSHWYCGCNPGTTSAIIWPWLIIVLWLRSRYYFCNLAVARVPLLLFL